MKLFFLLLLACALIIAPMTMLRPKPEQRRREQLRLAARELGLRFSLRSLLPRKTDMEPQQPTPCYYLPPVDTRLPQPSWLLRRMAYHHEGHFYQEWDWQGEGRANEALQHWLHEQVRSLPLGVSAFGSDTGGTLVCWNERGEKDGRDALTLLQDLHHFLLGIQAREPIEPLADADKTDR